MLDTKVYTCPPQVRDLPRDTKIGVTCRSCTRQWGESVQDLIEVRHMGAEFVDLLEWKYRCIDDACGGLVCITINGEAPAVPQVQPRMTVLTRPRPAMRMPERTPYPLKAVVQPRIAPPVAVPASRRQLSLPLGMS